MGPSRTGPRKGTAPLMPPTCTLGSRASCGQPVVLRSSGRMHGRHGTAGATLLSRGQNAGTKGWSQPRAKPGQLGGGPASWGPGAQCHHRAPDARRGRQDHLGHCVCPLTPLPSPPRVEDAPGMGRCGLLPQTHTHVPFWSQTPAGRKGVMEEGKEASPQRRGTAHSGSQSLHDCTL